MGILTYLQISVLALLLILFASCSESLYVRPFFVSPVIALIVVFMTIMALVGVVAHDRPLSARFILPSLVALVLFVNFSIYLVQPGIVAKPLYTTVDAYRDYINAVRIIGASAVNAQQMVFERYYWAFPVVPLQISVISLVGGLPANVAHLVMAVAVETIGVVCTWLLSTAVIRRLQPALAPSVGILATIVVWLQPYLIDPAWLLTPIRLIIPLVILVIYLVYRGLTKPGPPSRPVLLSTFILLLPIIPMHAVPTMVLIAFFVLVGLLFRRGRHSVISLAVIMVMYFSSYLLSSAATPLSSLAHVAKLTIATLVEILSGGSSFITETVLGSRINVHQSELDLFTQALPLALVMSMSTICIVRSLRPSVHSSEDRRLSSLHGVFGLLAMAGFGMGFLLPYFHAGVDMRYFVFPLTGLTLIACVVVLRSVLRNCRTSRMKGLILIGLVALFALSMTSSPLMLHEENPASARLIPIESESAAAQFVSGSVQEGRVAQIVTDYPFHSHVIGLMYPSRIGIEENITILAAISHVPQKGKETIVILRQYLLENDYLKSLNLKGEVLENVDKWNSHGYNRIFDSYSTSVYLGTFGG